jgi:hypothetical protein
MHQSIIGYRGARYFWFALGLSLASIVAYAWHDPPDPPNGGTWLGYTLGTIAALLIVWLLCLGLRKRSYSSQLGTVQGWTSAHVYLGSAVLIVATLHSGWQVGWNVHTLAYVLMCLVIFSGFFGIYAYVRYPNRVAENREGMTREQLFRQVADLDRQCVRTADAIDPETRALVQSAAERTSVGGRWWSQLTGADGSKMVLPATYVSNGGGGLVENEDQRSLVDLLSERLAKSRGGSEVEKLQGLLGALATKQALMRRVRRDIRFQALLEIWLYVHVPLSFGLLAALLVHIVSVFIYW